MGLFDFIKKKLFGKTQKVEESKKVDKKKIKLIKTILVSCLHLITIVL